MSCTKMVSGAPTRNGRGEAGMAEGVTEGGGMVPETEGEAVKEGIREALAEAETVVETVALIERDLVLEAEGFT